MKTNTARYKSDAFEAIHASATALHKVGAIPKATLREFDASCLIQIPDYAPEDVQRIRLANHLSQPIFAMYLVAPEKPSNPIFHAG
jgi:putative transcriptional regulator